MQYFWQFSPTVCAYYCMNWPRHHRRLIWNTTPWVSNSLDLLWKFVDGHIFLQDVKKLEDSNLNHCFVYTMTLPWWLRLLENEKVIYLWLISLVSPFFTWGERRPHKSTFLGKKISKSRRKLENTAVDMILKKMILQSEF